jgi:hypothetical protein
VLPPVPPLAVALALYGLIAEPGGTRRMTHQLVSARLVGETEGTAVTACRPMARHPGVADPHLRTDSAGFVP